MRKWGMKKGVDVKILGVLWHKDAFQAYYTLVIQYIKKTHPLLALLTLHSGFLALIFTWIL